MSVQLKKGILDLCVLHIINQQDTYGYVIYQKVDKILGISESTIYPILRRMIHEGYLDTYLEPSPGGPPRKYFTMTLEGKKQYRRLLREWQQFQDDVDLLLMR